MFEEDSIKRKLRRLKRLEIRLRFAGISPNSKYLVWTKYFGQKALYSLEQLAESHVRREAIEDYLFTLYQQYLAEQGLLSPGLDSVKLIDFGLPPDADPAQVKARFRELAKANHPDLGGSHEKMVELINLYRELMK